MAEFQEVMKQAKRMCDANCEKCPLRDVVGNTCPVAVIGDDEVAEIERAVMDWAAKNSELRFSRVFSKEQNPLAADMIDDLYWELGRVKRERDAAIADMERLQGLICQVCKEYHQPDPSVRKWACRVFGDAWAEIAEDGLIACGSFKWRGVQSDENA
jgi:hypothetical protein